MVQRVARARIASTSHVLLAASLLGACAPLDDTDLESTQEALSTRISGVTLRATLGNRFVGALDNGGGGVVATATVADAWERFDLVDVDGGALESGDTVHLRTGSGHYLQAANGGGSSLNAASRTASGWETFRIVKDGAGVIRSGDVIGLQAITSGHWVSAELGGEGPVHAYGAALGAWERFAIQLGAIDVEGTRVAGVTFRAAGSDRFVGAVDNGGGAVVASASVADAWETFTLIDGNGGALQSGDLVAVVTGNGRFFRAVDGGGAALDAAGVEALDWETFRIVREAGSGVVRSGDVVGLQALASGAWVLAENGGGAAVHAYGAAYGAWERFVVGIGPSWRLVWSDEFDGTTLDESKWVYEVQRPGWVNNELQSYTDRRRENVRVEDGHLVIEARRDFFGGEYSSGRIKTQGRASWTYGRFEARIQVPGGWGTWPAFWMMPDDQHRGWPACGEIDIMEHVGYDADVVHATTHTLAYNWRSPNQRTSQTRVPGATSGYHVYAAEWTPDRIDFYVDGVRYYTSPNDRTGDDAWPFDKRFHIILNLAVGGDWGGARGVDPNVWPQRMLVDYVRVYQR
ncbi:glycoside hydrolase family 16 protein [Sandaracinus amylolyticus]|uniref:glycoside hydrolase family 16 protein n=1 Tax=Sandaracinus amylolyticus TaxID=927083 RepID=UPI001F2B14E7|nr:glycoside hydrolase family 16 protein [Sandaracinus amylolyticus]UJR80628.1 Glycoside hydrolase family 16 protein [Sandaracinus amylolyticus]